LLSTPNIAERGSDLLAALSDDELVRYGEIARDQMRRELGDWWLQLLLTAGAVGSLVWMGWGVVTTGVGRSTLLQLGLAVALGYWPYRKAKVRALWLSHCAAVDKEQDRRRAAA
jgi:hypothetical protein